jgi:YVTN family beta-propeller protein
MINKKSYLFLFLLSSISSCVASEPNTVIGTVSNPNFSEPDYLAITPDGTKAYVLNTANDSISVVDLTTNTAIGTVLNPNFSGVRDIAITPDGTKAYVTNFSGGNVSIIDVATDTVTGTVSGSFGNPTYVAISPDGTKAYVSNVQPFNSRVSVINVSTDTVTGTVTGTFANPQGIAFTPDGTKAYVANQSDGVSVINVSTNTVTQTIAGFTVPFTIVITPDGSKAYVANWGNTTVSVIDVATNTIVKTITGFISTEKNLALTPDGAFLYVVNTFNDRIDIVSVATDTIIGTVNDPLMTFNEIFAMAITRIGNSLFGYVTNEVGNSVSIVFLYNLINSPTGFVACKNRDIFLTQIDNFNHLSWEASAPATNAITSYKIYRDASLTQLVATIAASGSLQLNDHNINPNINYTYYIVAIDSAGNVSSSVSITVSERC